MPGVLRALESVSSAEAQGKLAALGKVRNATKCSQGRDNLENRASVRLCGTCWEPLKTAGQPCNEPLAPQRRLESLGRLTQRPLKHSHLKKHTAVARATAGKVLASRCARQGQSTRRGLSSPPMK